MKKFFLALIILVAGVFVACSHQSNPTTEPPKPKATTYVDVQQVMQAKCTPCHLPSKGGRKADFENYAGAMKYGADMVTRVQLNPTDRGFMPFKNAKLSDDEINVFKKWVADGLLEK